MVALTSFGACYLGLGGSVDILAYMYNRLNPHNLTFHDAAYARADKVIILLFKKISTPGSKYVDMKFVRNYFRAEPLETHRRTVSVYMCLTAPPCGGRPVLHPTVDHKVAV